MYAGLVKHFYLLLLAVTLAAGCSSDAELIVTVRSDLTPGVEFDGIETSLFPGSRASGTPRVFERGAEAAEDFLAGHTVAEFAGLTEGPNFVRVRLVNGGATVLTRNVQVDLSGDFGITVVMSRDCLGSRCDAPDADEALTECVGGLCSDARCTVETPEFCPAGECIVDTDCPPAPACAEARCTDGLCLVAYRDDGCPAGETCGADGCTAMCRDDSDCPAPACADGRCSEGVCFLAMRDGSCPSGETCTAEGCVPVIPPSPSTCDVCGSDGRCSEECVGGCRCPPGCQCEFNCVGPCQVVCDDPTNECIIDTNVDAATVVCANGARCAISGHLRNVSCRSGARCAAACQDERSGSTVSFGMTCTDGAICCLEDAVDECPPLQCETTSCTTALADGTPVDRCNEACATPDPGCLSAMLP
ncbi:MAG: hypothetical protein DRJ42_19540 [Deltaproteobacteria bacterium]|nr:MAG: hypothetical protein DRJ42_19540 [Deltaproteobacteria bacterium]